MPNIFSVKINQKLLVALLAMAMLPHLMILSMFNMNATFTASFLDLEADDLQFMFAVGYGTIVCGLFLHLRFFHYFNIRSYLLVMTCLNIVVLFAMTLTTNTHLLFILRFIQGPLALFEGCILLPIIMSQMKRYYAKMVAYSIMYCLMMTSDKFTTSIIKFAIENYSHNMMIYTMIMFHTAALLIYVFVFNNNRMFAKKPLYRLNLPGVLMLMICLISGSFFLIYGKKYEWFDDYRIIISLAISLTFGGMFILYNLTLRKPLFHFNVLKAERVVLGLILFFFFYIFRASLSNVYQVMATVWKWPWTNILDIQYVNVAGTILGASLALVMMIKETKYRYIFTIAFLCLSSSMLWFSFIFYPDISPTRVFAPLFLEGLGQGIMFTPLVLYTIGAVHPNVAGNAALIGTAMRFWSNVIGFSLMQNLVLHLSVQRQNNMSSDLDLTSSTYQNEWIGIFDIASKNLLPNEAISVTAESFKGELISQSLLLANIDIFTVLAWIGFALAFVCFFYRKLKALIKTSY